MTYPGLGGQQPPPQNSAPAGQVTPGITPGVSGQVVRARQVIVSGAGEGVFVYSGTPAAGNPPIFWAGSSPDPYGNILPSTAGVAGTGTFQAGNTIITPAGIFTYSSTPAAGNLTSSTGTDAGGTDQFGNNYLAGNASYESGFANTMLGGAVIWYSGSLAGGWTAQGEFETDNSGDIVSSFPGDLVLSGGLTASGDTGTALPAGTPTGGPNSGTFAGHTHDFDGHTHPL
jgi:hypothetical protein